jgi:hypothetical protein
LKPSPPTLPVLLPCSNQLALLPISWRCAASNQLPDANLLKRSARRTLICEPGYCLLLRSTNTQTSTDLDTLFSSLLVPVVVLSSLLPDVSLMLDVVRDIEVPLPETLVPVTLDPEMLVPEMLVPEMLEPETFVPEMLEPETLVPEMLEREMLLRPVALLVSLSLDPETLRLLEEVVTLER